MLESVRDTLLRYCMLDGVTDVTVALSGGADSVALLSALCELKGEFGFALSAAHLNHCLRGDESNRDEQFVRELCEKQGIPLFCERADVRSFSEQTGRSIELAAREIRYEFLERVSKGAVATAHTANDNIETVLHNMARGTGILGVCGIPPKRGRFIRPLISVTRDAVEQYCAEKDLRFCVDSTNIDEAYTRNFIRHSVVPQLLKVNSNAVKNVSQMSETLRNDADYLKSVALDTLKGLTVGDGLDIKGLVSLHPAVASRCIAVFYEQQVGKTPEHQHIKAVTELLRSEGRVSVQNVFSAVNKNGVLRFVPLPKGESLPEIEVDTLPFCYRDVKIYKVTKENFKNLLKFNNLLLNNAIDYDKISGILSMRGRLPGDKIALNGRNCTKTFKKLFNEAKVDEFLREGLAVAADREGVVWLQEFGVDQRVAVSDLTETVLVFDILGRMNN